MSEKSWSQHGEDAIVANYFGDHIGTLVEIGAFHPTDMSNSRLLIERGWNAVLVDCSPRSVRDLLLEYGRHPKVKVVQAAVIREYVGKDHPEFVKMEITDDALSTSDPATRQKWDGYGYYGSLLACGVEVNRFIYEGAEFVSIDTEGTSLAIATKVLHWPKVRAICVEHDDHWPNFLTFARQHGYEQLALNGTNIIIARPK